MNRWIVAAAIPLAFGIALAACGGGNGDGTEVLGGPCPSMTPATAEIEGELTTDELVDLVAEVMTCPGYAFHMRYVAEYETELYGLQAASDVWIDIQNNTARTKTAWRAASGEALREAEEAGLDEDAEQRVMVIYLAEGRFSATELIGYPDEENQENQDPVARRGPPGCHGPGLEALGAVVPCEGPLQDLETTVVRDVSFEDREAIALLTEGESSDSDSTWAVESWLYFDADSLLPIGGADTGTDRFGDADYERSLSYEHEFVTLESLPKDFFEPASIGYEENLP